MDNKALDTSQLDWLYTDINDAQRGAVTETDGPVLILAGAGSGKTRVLTYRIAYILANGLAEPREILAMTFTNKAANEMRDRINLLVPEMMSGMWIGTFHSLFARMLRREADRLGYTSNFAIYDTADQATLIKNIISDIKPQVQEISPKHVAFRISGAKNQMIDPEDFAKMAEGPMDRAIADIYKEYQQRLKRMNAMDFDDLLIKPFELFTRYPLVKEFYQDRFRYILVDEYQDTNQAQYQVLKLFAEKYKNICVVGDDDQSIYRWRGAELRNILEYEMDYPGCKKFHLEQNYRSTKNILAAAHSVVEKNSKRHEKQLWTENATGEPVTLMTVGDEKDEARHVVLYITRELRNSTKQFYDFAILYRTNAQSRVLEDFLRANGLPYIIIGGVKFYERKEIKDILAYLRLLTNPADEISLKRVINFPGRGIGPTTLVKIEEYARQKSMTFYEAVAQVREIPSIQKKTAEKVYSFYKLIIKYTLLLKELPLGELSAAMVEELGIIRMYNDEGTIESQTRLENIKELLVAISEFSSNHSNGGTLDEFLQHVSLTTDIDTWNDKTNAITLMTLHAAKGLEFDTVFLTGLEEGLFPLSRSLTDPEALEEERRLFYVGATRAKERLYISWAKSRRRFGQDPASFKSRFLKELDLTYVQHVQSRYIQTETRKVPKARPAYQDVMPNYEDESQEYKEFSIGMRVKHPTFGRGTILKMEPSADRIKMVILFDTTGEKRVVYPFAKLEIL